jgi:hypothetical protein
MSMMLGVLDAQPELANKQRPKYLKSISREREHNGVADSLK